ncbi:MAG TPA: iron-sulfur cluster repair di-iron protein [Terriglobia bacterium]|nr:iron-sulfur cluster repair di-iron protein [Terriglobia bacterium]
MNINSETAVKEIALSNPAAKRILEQAGVDYCCGGSKSLHDACAQSSVSAEEILNRLRENVEKVGPADENWASAPLGELTRHIVEKHHRFVREAIPRMRALLAKVKGRHGASHPEIGEIERHFLDLGHEMTMHMQKEEMILFPYIDALERSTAGNETLEPPFFQTVRNPIQAMMKEHDAAGDLLRAMRDASRGYLLPADACMSYRELYEGLEAFEADLHTHVHLENNILFPRAVEMESAAA